MGRVNNFFSLGSWSPVRACTQFHFPNPPLVSFQIKQISEAWKYHALRKSTKHSASVPRPRPRRGTKPREMYTEVH